MKYSKGIFCGASEECQPVHNLYIFDQPKVGDSVFAGIFNRKAKSYYYRFVNHNDLVPRILPSVIMDYHHAGQKLYFDGSGKLYPNPFWQWECLDQWLYKWSPSKILNEDLGDHAMTAYIANLEKNQ
ncbi:MAG: lipase family protein [Candidatus Omnitrophota bacterium]